MDQQLAQRIAQFENMCQADPENEMAHFSLGNAYTQAGRHADAAAKFSECIRLAPGMSKAYQLAAESLANAGDDARAAQLAEEGYVVAAERGDIMPRNALGELLRALGRDVPEVKAESSAMTPGGSFVCTRTGRPGTKMDRPPFRGPVGQWIQDNITRETFDMWIGQGTKVINELRLDLSREDDAAVYDQHMYEYLGIDEALLESLRAGADAS